jgi:hypothetical protein
MAPIVNASFPVLLGLMQQLVANSSPTPQVAEFMKLVCKVRSRVTFPLQLLGFRAAAYLYQLYIHTAAHNKSCGIHEPFVEQCAVCARVVS